MAHTGLIDALAARGAQLLAEAGQRRLAVTPSERRKYDKWSATVQVEGPQRDGYLSVWSSGELDCQVFRDPEFLILNEHRFVQRGGSV